MFQRILDWLKRWFFGEGEIACAAEKLTNKQLQAIVDGSRGWTYLYFESPAEADLIAYPNEIKSTDLDFGQAFNEKGELRWQRHTWLENGQPKSGWQVVYVGNGQQCPTFPVEQVREELNTNKYKVRHELVKLWGESTNRGTWLEARIPRLLNYPWSGAPVGALGMRVCRYEVDGQIAFERFVGLEGWTL